ncbi:MAG: SdpI family protein [Candidatus Cloacimonetes bacterium]|nr:SdpI family protein [Candidatus Cloacimonadota bacterium]
MKRLSKFKWSLAIIVVQLIVMGYFAFTLPADAKVPTHWNINNEIDGYSGKAATLILWSGLSIGMFLLFFLMPWYSPWYKKYEKRFERILPALTVVMVLFFALISIYSLYLAKSQTVPGVQFILILIGLLFIFLGNLMPKTPRNFFVGIKTPWTLANDDVWQRTHRLGGKLFAVSGVIMIIKGFVLPHDNGFQQISGAIAMLILLSPLIYSFIIFQKYKDK